MKILNSNKIILDLCGGTGSWSEPYRKAGYDVRNITLPDYDILLTDFVCEKLIQFHGQSEKINSIDIQRVYGILSAPPCTMFSLARTRAKTPRNLAEGCKLVEKCLEVIWYCRKYKKLAFWAMENPMGYLRQFMGKPPFHFNPWEFGDPYTKGTDIWGYFNFPVKKYKVMTEVMTEEQILKCKTNSRQLPSISDITGSKQKIARAITPAGFAKAFYEANK